LSPERSLKFKAATIQLDGRFGRKMAHINIWQKKDQ